MTQQNPIVTKFEFTDPKRIKMGQQLDAGLYGPVCKAKLLPANRGGMEETVAVRIIPRRLVDCRVSVAEVRTTTSLDHENVVKIKGICDGVFVDGRPQVWVIMELCDGGSLYSLMESDKLTERDKAQALLEIAKGVAFLHKRGVIHRYIGSRSCLAHKTGNRVIFKISDYGFTSAIDLYDKDMYATTPCFRMSPEAMYAKEWTKASDVWAFGILIMELYNKGRNPYEQRFKLWELFNFLSDGNLIDPPAGMPPELKKIVEKCTQKENRPGMDEIVGMLIEYFQKMK